MLLCTTWHAVVSEASCEAAATETEGGTTAGASKGQGVRAGETADSPTNE